MIRALLSTILRMLLWFFAFYLVLHVIRGIVRAVAPPPPRKDPNGPPEQGPPVAGRPSGPPVDYRDVKDAKFSDLSDPPSDARPS